VLLGQKQFVAIPEVLGQETKKHISLKIILLNSNFSHAIYSLSRYQIKANEQRPHPCQDREYANSNVVISTHCLGKQGQPSRLEPPHL